MCVCCQTLLDLGASPDYKDSRGLTPLYHSSMVGGDPYCCELLLHDHAQVGCMDENGWQEIHQVTHNRQNEFNYNARYFRIKQYFHGFPKDPHIFST